MSERRKARRFPMRQPATLTLHGQGSVHVITSNVSEWGALIVADSPVPVGTALKITITLQAEDLPPVELASSGKVVRVEPVLQQPRVAIAVECSRGFQPWGSAVTSRPHC